MKLDSIPDRNVLIYAISAIDLKDSLSATTHMLHKNGAKLTGYFSSEAALPTQDDLAVKQLDLSISDELLTETVLRHLTSAQPAYVLLPAFTGDYQRLASIVWEAMRRNGLRHLIVGELDHPLHSPTGWHAAESVPVTASTLQREALRRFRIESIGNSCDGNTFLLVDPLDDCFPSERVQRIPLPTPSYRIDIIVRTSGRDSLKRAIHSVFAQTWSNIGLIVVNIGPSSLNEWLNSLTLPSTVTLTVINAPSAGRSLAANLGLAATTGEAFAFLDDDDLLYPSHLSLLSRALDTAPTSIVAYGGVRIEKLDRHGNLYSIDLLNEDFYQERLYLANFIPIHAALTRRRVLESGIKFDETLDCFEDWDFWLRCSEVGSIVHVPEVVAIYFAGDASGASGASVTPVYERWLARRGIEPIEKIARWALSKHTPGALSIKLEADILESRLRVLETQLAEEKRHAIENEREFERWRLSATSEADATMNASLMQELASLRAERARLELVTTSETEADINASLMQELASLRAERERLGLACLELEHKAAQQLVEQCRLENNVESLQRQIDILYASTSWRLLAPMRACVTACRTSTGFFIKAGTLVREHGGWPKGIIHLGQRFVRAGRRQGFYAAFLRVARLLATPSLHSSITVPEFRPQNERPVRAPISSHSECIDIVVCIHNALTDVQRCIASLQQYTQEPYHLILVDDGSFEETRNFLADNFQHKSSITLIRNEVAGGYTKAANAGLRASKAAYVVLLNSDTIVGPAWLDRLFACLNSDERIALVGPLSNCASWQSVPEIESSSGGDWAENPLPDDCSPTQMAERIAEDSMRIYPRLVFINGFCQLIRRSALNEVGLLDEEAFPQGYGEENDMCLRLRSAGWTLAVADDVWVYHAQSKSYSNERRKRLCDAAAQALANKHGQFAIDQGVAICRDDIALFGIRSRVAHIHARQNCVNEGKEHFKGRRVLFLLPSTDAGGGANVIMTEAVAMRRMGVDACILNLKANEEHFSKNYNSYSVPVHYVYTPDEVAAIACEFDAVVASIYYTVDWLNALIGLPNAPVLGYYIQDFEPYFFPENSDEYRRALDSYGAIPDLKRFCKTRWNRDIVREQTGLDCALVGPSFDIDLFRPTQRQFGHRVRICAMVRPNSPYRSPALTMQVLGDIYHLRADKVEITTFGVDGDDPAFLALRRDFPFTHMGKLNSPQIAAILDQNDIFVDLSTHQAMGLTALEAMASFTAVVLPGIGGTPDFAENGKTALFIDANKQELCIASILRLIDNTSLRLSLSKAAQASTQKHFPELAGLRILQTLFPNT